jgi:RNA polymerase sigma-70 factor (ECF subfamily)
MNAVQETWVRLSRADTTDVQNLDGWLTTVVGRVCLKVRLAGDGSGRERDPHVV